MVRPVAVQLLPVLSVEQDFDSPMPLTGLAVATYPVMGSPPSLSGVCHVTVAWESVALADQISGAAGIVEGSAGSEASLWDPVPSEFVADTLNRYETPFNSPVTLQDVAPVVVHWRVIPKTSGEAMTV